MALRRHAALEVIWPQRQTVPMTKVPSPCIDVCKYKNAGRCTGCAMTKAEKKRFKTMRTNRERRAFVAWLAGLQVGLGGYCQWPAAYRRKCATKAVDCPLDLIDAPQPDKAA